MTLDGPSPEFPTTPSQAGPLSPRARIKDTDLTVEDFWQWGFSDLKLNIVRGVLAEFLVASAVGDPAATVRNPWANFDVLTPEGLKIEVKSSGYLQAGPQKQLSSPRFSGLLGRTWEPLTGYSKEREIRADLFVFCLHTARTHAEYDPLDTGQWVFWVIPAETVKKTGRRAVGVSFCEHNANRIMWDQLQDAVTATQQEAT